MTPRAEPMVAVGDVPGVPEIPQPPVSTVIAPGSAEEMVALKAKYDQKQRMIREMA